VDGAKRPPLYTGFIDLGRVKELSSEVQKNGSSGSEGREHGILDFLKGVRGWIHQLEMARMWNLKQLG
jgi:hypothetical protein